MDEWCRMCKLAWINPHPRSIFPRAMTNPLITPLIKKLIYFPNTHLAYIFFQNYKGTSKLECGGLSKIIHHRSQNLLAIKGWIIRRYRLSYRWINE